jgi:acetone carboxylase beta subunit
VLPEEADAGPVPPKNARLGQRRLYHRGVWEDADVWSMEALMAGNRVVGPAIIESPATTFVLPPGFETSLDKHRIFHLKECKFNGRKLGEK